MQEVSVYSKVIKARDFYTDEPTFRMELKEALDWHDRKIKGLCKEYGIRPTKLQKKSVKFSIITQIRKAVTEPDLRENVRKILADFERDFESEVWRGRKSA